MKNIKFLILALAVLSLSSGLVLAHEGMNHEKGMETADHENKSAITQSDAKDMRVATEEDIKNLPNVGNKLCPVSSNPVDDGTMGEAVKYVYNGKIYNLCCQMCVKDFKKNPLKYSAAAEKEVSGQK